MSPEDQFVDAFQRLINDDEEIALAAITGAFVAYVTGITEAKGLDASKKITIDGGDERDITIHAEKEPS